MRLEDILLEGRDASLWHAYRDIDHCVQALKNNEMLGTSTQRWWDDEKHYRDDQGEIYEKSYWMKGISLTRDSEFAKTWGSIIIELDQRLLSQNYKIIPFSWQKTFGLSRLKGTHPHYKKEREEFLILEKEPNTFYKEDEYETFFDYNAFKTPAKRKLKPLDRYLKGIWLEEFILNLYNEKKTDPRMEYIQNHPKYKGLYFTKNRLGISK